MQPPPQSKAFNFLALMLGFILPFGLFACGSNPNPSSFEGRKISSVTIQFKGEHRGVDESRIQRFISSKAGTIYSSARLDADIKSLWWSGYVDDVRFLAEPQGERIKLIVEITARAPLVSSRMVIIGNTAFSDLKLAKISGLKSDKKPTEAQLETARRHIEKFYQSSGYKDVKVTLTHPWKDKGDDDTFAFLIQEGSKNQL